MNKNTSRIFAFASAAILLSGSPAFAQSTWTGLGSDSNWSTADNWDVAPTFPASLNFSGTTRLDPHNDLSGITVGTGSGTAITFAAAAGEFALGGNAITLAGHVAISGDPATVVTQAITMPLSVNQTVGFTAPSNGVLSVSGGISASGAYGIWKGGPGRMVLGAGNTFGGQVFCYGGTLQFGANNVLNSSPGSLWLFANSADAPVIVDLAGTSQLIPNLSLGGSSPGVNGLSNALMDSVGGGVFKVGNNISCYAGGSGFSNATTTISATWDVNGVDRGIFVGRNPSNAVDLLLSGPIINSVANSKGFLLYKNGNAGVVMMTSTDNAYDGQLSVRDNLLILGANNTLPTNSSLGLVSLSGTSPVVDLYGTTNMVKGLSFGAGSTSVAGATPSIIDSVGGGVLKLGTFNVAYNAGGSGQNGTATVSATLELNGGNRAFNINDSTYTSVEVQVNGAIINSVGTAGINKNSAGVLILAGTNTYNGNTTVNAGTLTLAAGGQLKFVIGNNGVNNQLTGSGTVNLDGDFYLDISGAAAAPGNSWTLVNVGALTETFGSTFLVTSTLGAFAENANVWTLQSGIHSLWTFTESTGVLGFSQPNNAPVARNVTNSVAQGGIVTIPFDLGKYKLATDAENDSLTITSVSASLGNVGTDGSSINYTNTGGSVGTFDSISFTVADNYGGTNSAAVAVLITSATGANLVSATAGDGNAYLSYAGIPGYNYALDKATSITPPITWVPQLTNTADSVGRLNYTNLLSAWPTNDFFRTRHVP